MKISRRLVNDIRIKSVFFPSAGAITSSLFAEFHDEGEVLLIKKYARNLGVINECRFKLVQYVPKSLIDRFTAVEKKAFDIRTKTPYLKTRIWIGVDEIELRVRHLEDERAWSLIKPETLTNLPPQGPKKVRSLVDRMEVNTPITPAFPISSSIMNSNNFNLLNDFSDE